MELRVATKADVRRAIDAVLDARGQIREECSDGDFRDAAMLVLRVMIALGFVREGDDA